MSKLLPSRIEGGVVQSIVAGTNVIVDNSDPTHPTISATGGGGGGRVLLASSTLAADASSITLTGLSPAYTDLLIRCFLRNSASPSRYCNLRVGGGGAVDTGVNYDSRSMNMPETGTGLTTFNDTGATSIFLRGAIPGSGAAFFGCVEFLIPRYSDPSQYRTVAGRGDTYLSTGGGLWKNATTAIDTVQVANLASGEMLKAGSRMDVYGIS